MPHQQFKSSKEWQKHIPKKKKHRSSHSMRSKIPSHKKKNSIGLIIFHIIKSPFKTLNINTKGLVRKIITFIIVVGLFGSLFLVALIGYYSSKLPDVHSILTRFVAESTKIYDRTGETLLWEIHGDEKRTIVDLDQISPNIKNALIAAEDKHFYKHKGFSIVGIARAALRNIFTGSTQGGSTITQQMIKNTILTREKTYTRKIKELILAREAENTFTKDEILKIYLNTINYGGVNYGVESASQAFFGKTSKDVSIAEAAILAALPQAPTRLSPYGNNIDQLMARKDWVIDRMLDEEYISEEQATVAKQENIIFQELKVSNIKAPHFVFYVRELLAEEFGEDVLNQGGLKVITTLDWNKQEMAEDVIRNANEFNLEKGATNAALVALNAKSGEILAMVGSQDYFNDDIDGQVNVTIEPRQPGSSIKPIVYAAALEKGFTPNTVVYDVNTNFAVSGKPYEPRDYDLKERGPVTMRTALQGSLNIPAVKFLYLAGIDNVMQKMEEKLGYSTINSDLDCGLSLVLGGCEVTLLDHTAAYTAFARDGKRAEPAAILEVYDANGKQLFKFKKKNYASWDKNVARTMNTILSDNAARAPFFGEANSLTLGSRPVAAKTGTTNDYNDAWTIGYTPSFVTGVWVGNSDGTDMKRGAGGSSVAAPIWNAFMKKMLANSPVEYFKGPDELPSDLKPALAGNIAGDTIVEIDRFSKKLPTENTPQSTKILCSYNQHHTILYYVNKNDPRGAPPEEPSTDPAYAVWEAAVQDWVARKAEAGEALITTPDNPDSSDVKQENTATVYTDRGLCGDFAPTEEDDVHKPELTPTININTPANKSLVDTTTLNVTVTATAPQGISRVEYYLDNNVIGISRAPSLDITLTFTDVSSGFHQLKAIAYDSVDNQKESTIELNFNLPYIAPNVNWISPRNRVKYYASSFPLPINFELTKLSDISHFTVYSQKNDGSAPVAIESFNNITEKSFSTLWDGGTPGTYELFAEFVETTGTRSDSKRLQITVLE